MLLQRGASVGLTNSYGRTALMMAAAVGHYPMVKLLLSVGAATDSVDSWGRDAADWAEARGHSQLVPFLRGAAEAQKERQRQLVRGQAQQAATRGIGGGGGAPHPDDMDDASDLTYDMMDEEEYAEALAEEAYARAMEAVERRAREEAEAREAQKARIAATAAAAAAARKPPREPGGSSGAASEGSAATFPAVVLRRRRPAQRAKSSKPWRRSRCRRRGRTHSILAPSASRRHGVTTPSRHGGVCSPNGAPPAGESC